MGILNPVHSPSMILEAPRLKNEHSLTSTTDTDLFNKHIGIISEWDRGTFALKAFQSIGTEEVNGENDVDDEDEKEVIPGDHLLDQYLDSRVIIRRQQNRINRVTNEEHLLQLVNRKNLLSESSREYEMKCASDEKEVAAADE